MTVLGEELAQLGVQDRAGLAENCSQNSSSSVVICCGATPNTTSGSAGSGASVGWFFFLAAESYRPEWPLASSAHPAPAWPSSAPRRVHGSLAAVGSVRVGSTLAVDSRSVVSLAMVAKRRSSSAWNGGLSSVAEYSPAKVEASPTWIDLAGSVRGCRTPFLCRKTCALNATLLDRATAVRQQVSHRPPGVAAR